MRHHTSMTFNVDQQCCASGATTRAVKTRDFFLYIMKFKFGLWEMLRHHIIKQSCLSPLFTCILPSQSHHAKGGTTRSTTITTSHHIITSESQVYSLPLGRMNIMNSGRGWMAAVGAWVVSHLEPLVFFFFFTFFYFTYYHFLYYKYGYRYRDHDKPSWTKANNEGTWHPAHANDNLATTLSHHITRHSPRSQLPPSPLEQELEQQRRWQEWQE